MLMRKSRLLTGVTESFVCAVGLGNKAKMGGRYLRTIGVLEVVCRKRFIEFAAPLVAAVSGPELSRT